jgi:hypothetical protein
MRLKFMFDMRMYLWRATTIDKLEVNEIDGETVRLGDGKVPKVSVHVRRGKGG